MAFDGYFLVSPEHSYSNYARAMARLDKIGLIPERIVQYELKSFDTSVVSEWSRGWHLGGAIAHQRAANIMIDRGWKAAVVLDEDAMLKPEGVVLPSGFDIVVLGDGAYIICNPIAVYDSIAEWLGRPDYPFWEYRNLKQTRLDVAWKELLQ